MKKETANQWFARFEAAPPALQGAMMLTKKCRDRLEALRAQGVAQPELLAPRLILEATELHEDQLTSMLRQEVDQLRGSHIPFQRISALRRGQETG